MKRFKLLTPCFIVMVLFLFANWAYAATFTVDNLGDVDDGNPYTLGDGTNTLRKCIRLANETPGADTINFIVSGMITPTSTLPEITDDGTVIDASSQWIGTWPSGQPGITLDGASAGDNVNGLILKNANNCRIRGLFITNFGGNGINLAKGAQSNTIGGKNAGERNIISGNDGDGVNISGSGTNSNIVSGNYIGTDVNGTDVLGNSGHGIKIGGAQSNIIGGTTEEERNIISGNNQNGISFRGGYANVVSGNYIGTDINGTDDLGNSGHGVNIGYAAQNNIIGGATAGKRNIISGNDQNGVLIHGSNTQNNVVSGNYIGTDVSGTDDWGNSEHGIKIQKAQFNTVAGNKIAFNGNDGVKLNNDAAVNEISGNSIHDNKGTIKVYVDESRSLQLGNKLWKSLSQKDGYFHTRNMDLIEYEQLKCYDVMIIRNDIEILSYSEKELEAIRRFVENGGGLLVSGNGRAHAKTKARFSQGRWLDLMPVPQLFFSTNQIAELFGVAFTNASRSDTPNFNTGSPLNIGLNFSLLAFKQHLSPLICENTKAQVLIDKFNMPIVVSLEHGKGRAIFCGANRIFIEYGSSVDRKLGKMDKMIEVQKRLLDKWLRWLAYNGNSQQYFDFLKDILPRVKLVSEQADFYCIPQLKPHTEKLMDDFGKIWADFSEYLDISSPLEFLRKVEPGTKLSVKVRAAKAGGLSGGTSVSVPVMGKKHKPAGVFSHEVGHKLLGGVNGSASEAFAEWLNCRGLRATGHVDVAEEKMNQYLTHFREVDPVGKELDIVDRLSDTQERKACMGKWMWILSELERKYGDDFIKRYVKCLRSGLELSGSHRKIVDGKSVKISMDDIVHFMSKAAGEDLVPWFQELGITVRKLAVSPYPWDTNGDDVVDVLDLVLIAQNFGQTSATDLCGDVNVDGAVDVLDLIKVGLRFGEKVHHPDTTD